MPPLFSQPSLTRASKTQVLAITTKPGATLREPQPCSVVANPEIVIVENAIVKPNSALTPQEIVVIKITVPIAHTHAPWEKHAVAKHAPAPYRSATIPATIACVVAINELRALLVEVWSASVSTTLRQRCCRRSKQDDEREKHRGQNTEFGF